MQWKAREWMGWLVVLAGAGVPAGAVDTVAIDLSVTNQTIIGWGVGAGHFAYSQKDSLRLHLIDEIVEGLGLTRARFEPGGGTGPDGPGWELWNDDGDPTQTATHWLGTDRVDWKATQFYVPMKQRVEANGEPFNTYVSVSFFNSGSSGSAPAWLLNSPGEHTEFLTSLLLRLKNVHGITADYCTVVNEAGNDNPFSAALCATTIKTLGPRLTTLGLPTKIQFPECAATPVSWSYISAVQNDPDIWPYIGLLSYHLYWGPDTRTSIRDFGLARGIPTAQTEYMGLTLDHLFADLTGGGVSVWEWYGMNDCLPVDASHTWFSRTSQYWQTRQITRYVRPGAKRVGTTSSSSFIRPLAFTRNGKTTVVLLNNTAGNVATTVDVSGLGAGTYGVCESSTAGVYQEKGLVTVTAGATLAVPVARSTSVTVYPYAGANLPPVLTDWRSSSPFLTLPATSTTLSAAAQDPELNAVAYAWSVVSQPAGASVALSTPTAATCGVSGLTQAGDYVFAVAVSDPTHTVTRTVEVPVNAVNLAPIVDVHNRIPVMVTLPTSSTTLRGSGWDTEGDPLTAVWSVVSQPVGAAAALAMPTSNSCVVAGLTVAGNYVFQFSLSDPTHTVSRQLTVPVYPANTAPVVSSATASPATITLPVASTSLAAVTSDPDAAALVPWRAGGDVLTHWWSVKSAPTGASPVFADPGTTNTVVGGLTVPGAYVFTLTAIDRTLAGTRDVTVTASGAPAPPVLTTVAVSPASTSVTVGNNQQFAASAKDQYGAAMVPQPTFTWSVGGGGGISVGGLFTAGGVAGGPYAVTAASGGVTGTASVVVSAATPVLTTITVSPASASVTVGNSQQFAASAKDQYGAAMVPQPTFTWSVGVGGSISVGGLFTAGGAAGGPFTVSAISGGVTGTASVAVTALAPPPTSPAIAEFFNDYGTSTVSLAGRGAAGGGWAGAWAGNTAPFFVPGQNLTFANSRYDNSYNALGADDGLAAFGSLHAGAVATRTFAAGLTGTVWLSALVRYSSLSADVLLSLEANGVNFVGLRRTGSSGAWVEPVIRYNTTGNDTANNVAFAVNTTWLLVVRIGMNASGTADNVDFWIKGASDAIGSPADLGTPIYSKSGQDAFGAEFNYIGISFLTAGTTLDSLRISNESDAFAKVVALPPAGTLLFMR